MKKKLSIGGCIKLSYLIILILMLVIATISYENGVSAIAQGDKVYNECGKTQGEAGLAFAYFQEVKCNLRNTLYLYADNKNDQQKALESIQTSEDKMYDYLDQAADGLSDKKALELLQEARDNIDAYISDVDICTKYVNAGNIDDARKHLKENGVASANAAADSINQIQTRLDKLAVEAQSSFVSAEHRGQVAVGIAFAISILAAVTGIFYLLKQIQRPVLKLAKAADNLAVGEIQVELPEKCDLSEVAELDQAFRSMIENLQEQANVIQNVAQGNLQVQIKAHSEKDVVGSALEKLLYDDNQVFRTIRNATNQISVGSGQIAAASQSLAQGSTEQASAIQQIAASISDIAGKTKENAAQADEVNQIVLKAKGDVTAGNERMEEMVAAMKEISEASENIQKIIKVIDDIAFNTNILALNATVEAARAGEQGKGFAVVAEEVRNLAGRSAEASSQTAEMIEDSIHKVKRGGELAKQTAEALQLVSEMIEKITDLSENIASASNDQASATAQIDQALMQVSQVVQTNSATSEQCASASEELSGQARGLNGELAKFQLKDIVGDMPEHTLGYEEPMMLGDDRAMKY